MRKYLFIFLLLCSFYVLLPEENTNFVRFKNFISDGLPEDAAGYHELKIWANYQMLELLPDDPGYGLKDGMCSFVPAKGLTFLLTANPDIKKMINLFIDFAMFRPMSEFAGSLNHSLKVSINGKHAQTIFYAKQGLKSPVMIQVDPASLVNGKMNVSLMSDAAQGRFWCIWDAYYSYEKY